MNASIGQRVRERLLAQDVPQSNASVARQIGLAPDAFSRSLSGQRAFTATELVELGRVLQTSSHWLITGEDDPYAIRFAGRHAFDREAGVHVPIDWDDEHRPLADIALAYVQGYGGRDLEVTARVPATARAVRRRLVEHAGAGFVRRLADEVEAEFGVDIVRTASVTRAFAVEVLGRAVIVIPETANWCRENWDIAHELGHIAAGDLSALGDEACDDRVAELRANRFAAELLLPADLVRQVDWQHASGLDLAEFVWRTGVSTEALSIRFSTLRTTISTEVRDSLTLKTQRLVSSLPDMNAEIARRGAEATRRRFPADLVAAHQALVSEGLLGADTLAWMLGVQADTIESELAPPVPDTDLDELASRLGLTS